MTLSEAERILRSELFYAETQKYTTFEGCEVQRCTLVERKGAKIVGEYVMLRADPERYE